MYDLNSYPKSIPTWRALLHAKALEYPIISPSIVKTTLRKIITGGMVQLHEYTNGQTLNIDSSLSPNIACYLDNKSQYYTCTCILHLLLLLAVKGWKALNFSITLRCIIVKPILSRVPTSRRLMQRCRLAVGYSTRRF